MGNEFVLMMDNYLRINSCTKVRINDRKFHVHWISYFATSNFQTHLSLIET